MQDYLASNAWIMSENLTLKQIQLKSKYVIRMQVITVSKTGIEKGSTDRIVV